MLRVWNGDQVGLTTKINEGSDGLNPTAHITPDQKFGISIDRCGDQQSRVTQINSRCESLKPGSNRYSARTLIVRHHIDVAFGVVEFFNLRWSDGIGRRKHPVIDRCITNGDGLLYLRTFNTQFWISLNECFWAKTFNEIRGKAITASVIHRTDGESIAVGEDEVTVLPGFGLTR